MSRKNLRLSVVEHNLEESSWNMAQDYLKQAEALYRQNDQDGAYKVCKRILELSPGYYPAKKLMKCIDKGESYDADEQHRELPSLQSDYTTSDSETDDTNSREYARKPATKTVQLPDDTMDLERLQPMAKPLKGILKEDKCVAGPSESGHFSGSTNKLDRGGRREKYLRELLLEGHFYQKSPMEVFHGVKEIIWSEDKGKYVCPVKHCALLFQKRAPCVEHFLDIHLPSDPNGLEVQPYACKTCKNVRFRSLENLVKHGEAQHPRSQWVQPLSIAMRHKC